MVKNLQIDTDTIIDAAVDKVFKQYEIENLKINQYYYQQIKNELDYIFKYFTISQQKQTKREAWQYSAKYGFSTSQIAYEISLEKKNQSIVYNRINKILSYLRDKQEITYSLYIKDLSGRYYRYEVPENEIENFTTIVQQNAFNMEEDLINYSNNIIQQLEQQKKLSDHIQNYMKAIDQTGLFVKQADRYEAFEYHFQKIDKKIDSENYHNNFNIEGIRRWILGRGHDTAGWYQRGDIELTSVKSVDLSKKHILLSLASQKSLQKTYSLLKEIFNDSSLNQQKISRLVKAFTPTVQDLKKGLPIDVEKIVQDLIQSLTK